MRYMGAADDYANVIGADGGVSFLDSGRPLDEVSKGLLIAKMATLTDAQGEDMTDLADATSYGKRTMRFRYAVGAIAGAALAIFFGGFVRGLRGKRR